MPPTFEAIPVLPASVPIPLPDVPKRLMLSTAQHFHAASDPVRWRMLALLSHPMTAKQLAEQLAIPHGTIGYHLQVLEEAGLILLVAKRLIRNMTAKYYVRAAQIFDFRIPPEITGPVSFPVRLISQVRDEVAEAVAEGDPAASLPTIGLRYLRLSPTQAQAVQARLTALLDECSKLVPDPEGVVYGICTTMYTGPPLLQQQSETTEPDEPSTDS
jgi:DNA-binding transcriptional ArsR family regulator